MCNVCAWVGYIGAGRSALKSNPLLFQQRELSNFHPMPFSEIVSSSGPGKGAGQTKRRNKFEEEEEK